MVYKNKTPNQAAFSLVELSVVLIILGLLAAGITAGNSLVKGSKSRAIVAELNNYQTAINSFVLQYEMLPGDLTNAFDYWGGTDCTDAVITNQAANNKACNGNGNGQVTHNPGEGINAWEHLSNADLLPGNFPGFFSTAGQVDIGVNAPASKWKPAGYSFNYNASAGRNRINIGGFNSGSYTSGLIFTPREMSNIDKKMDDGLPRKGVFWGTNAAAGAAGCINGAQTAYNLNLETKVCMGIYLYEGPIN